MNPVWFLMLYVGGFMLGFVAIDVGLDRGERRRGFAWTIMTVAVLLELGALYLALRDIAT